MREKALGGPDTRDADPHRVAGQAARSAGRHDVRDRSRPHGLRSSPRPPASSSRVRSSRRRPTTRAASRPAAATVGWRTSSIASRCTTAAASTPRRSSGRATTARWSRAGSATAPNVNELKVTSIGPDEVLRFAPQTVGRADRRRARAAGQARRPRAARQRRERHPHGPARDRDSRRRDRVRWTSRPTRRCAAGSRTRAATRCA